MGEGGQKKHVALWGVAARGDNNDSQDEEASPGPSLDWPSVLGPLSRRVP